jgi:TusA-related sulfurtransferase
MIEIDCLGEMCPIPLLKAKEAFKTIQSGETVKIITDHSCVHQNILDHFNRSKISIEDDEVINGVWEIIITKL